MKLTVLASLMTGLAIAGSVAATDVDDMHHCKGMGMEMKSMDSNGDGMISKEEFMKYHEAKFDSMKNSAGMLDMKTMGTMHEGMKKDSMTKPMPKDSMAKDPMSK